MSETKDLYTAYYLMEKIFIDPANIDKSLIKKAAEVISQNGIVALPTDTVYGLAGRADTQSVVDRLYEIKQRPKDKPFTYVVESSQKAIDDYFAILPPFGYRLIEKLWPGPITIVYHTPRDQKIGIRVPSCVITLDILKELNMPVYLPSANISGKTEAQSAQDVEDAFNNKVDLVIDSGKQLSSKPSTVIDLTYRPFKILREGAISEGEIIEIFIKKRITFICTGNTCRSPMAEFLLKKYLVEAKPHLAEKYEIISAGTSFRSGAPAAPSVIGIMQEKEGLDLGGFSSQELSREIVLSSEYIFTMADAQSDYILGIEPTAEGRVFALKKFLSPTLEKDIPDPIGKSYSAYEEAYDLIKEAILELREWL